MIERQDIAVHLEQGVKTEFLLGFKSYAPKRSPFCGEKPSDGAFEIYTEMGSPPWPTQNAGKPGPGGTDARTGVPAVNTIDGGQQVTVLGGIEKGLIVRNIDWEITTGMTHNAINDDRVGDLLSWANSSGAQFEKHKDYESFNALNAGESTASYGAGYDGLSFFNDAHVDPGASYTTTQDNKLATAFSADNFKAARIAAAKFRDDIGQPVGLSHNLLVVPVDLEWEAMQITRNPQVYGNTDLDINPYAGVVRALVAPGGWLDTTAWYLIDDSMPIKPLYLQVRKNPSLVMWDDEKAGDGGMRYFKFHARYTVFYGDWRLAIQGNT